LTKSTNSLITTVIVPVYEGNKLIEVKECMNSLFKQTYKNFNILLIYDGKLLSNVKSYLDNIVKKNKEVTKIKIEKNIGLAKALNRGIQNTQSDFIVRVDADSISKPKRLERQIQYLVKNDRVDVLGATIEEIKDNGEKYYQKMPLSHHDCLHEFKFRNPISHPTVIFRKTFFEKAGLYPIDYYKDEDSALWLNGFMNGCVFANLNEALVECRLDNDLLERRKDFKGIVATFTNKLRIINKLKFGFVGYCFALFRLIIMLSPKWLLMRSYLLRNRIWKMIKKK
jgi:glycosyltransferase involved in cell wall biosynthesis